MAGFVAKIVVKIVLKTVLKTVLGVALLLACGTAVALQTQISAPADALAHATADALQGKLDRLAAASDDLQKRLPNFACKETLVSQEIRDGKVKNEVRATGDLRIERVAEGKAAEHFQATERNGKTAGSGKLKAPVFMYGGFSNALDTFQLELQPCFRFALTGDRLDFNSRPDAQAPRCKEHAGTTGFALLGSDGTITHLERRIASEIALQRKAAPFAAIDFKRVEFGGVPFSLSSHVTAVNAMGQSTFNWEASYSDCQLFRVSVTLGPASAPVSEPEH